MKCCDLIAGKLRNTIVIQTPTQTADGAGGSQINWTTVISPKAFIKPLSGGEQLQAMKIQATITHRIYIRYNPAINAKMRVLFNGRVFNIRSAINLEERNRWTEMSCEEGVAD